MAPNPEILNMKSDDYSGAPIIKNPWPEWMPVEGGGLARQWMFEFDSPVPDDSISSDGLDESDLQVSVERGASETMLILTTTTQANAWSDEGFFFAFYRLFERLESKFGRLKTIQGQARDLWRPFR